MQSGSDIPPNTIEAPSLGDIRINEDVVASIVRLAALSVSGVAGVGGGFVDGLGDLLGKRQADHRGVRVTEDEEDNYSIDVRLIIIYGTDIARTGYEVQVAVRKQVMAMTGKNVSRVDVFIEGVRLPAEASQPSTRDEDLWPEAPATD